MPNQQPITKRANLPRRVAVVAGSVGITLYYSLKVLSLSMLGLLSRKKVDGYTRTWSRDLLRMVRVKLTVKGTPPDFNDGRRYIIMCNHSSHYDIPATFVALSSGSIRMLAKQELFQVPIWGRAMRTAEFACVSRNNKRQAVKDLARAREMMESGIVIWAAPEGTRSPDGRLQRFKKGCFYLALDTDAIILPIAIRGIHHVLPARTWEFNLDQPVELVVGQPIDATDYDHSRLADLMDDTRQQIERMLTGDTVLAPPFEASAAIEENPVV